MTTIWHRPVELGPKIYGVLVAMFGFMAVFLLSHDAIVLRQTGQEAQATVESVRQKGYLDFSKGNFCFVMLSFETMDGQTVRGGPDSFLGAYSFFDRCYRLKAGDRVTVLYNRTNASTFQIKNFDIQFGWSMIIAIGALYSLGKPFGIWKKFRGR